MSSVVSLGPFVYSPSSLSLFGDGLVAPGTAATKSWTHLAWFLERVSTAGKSIPLVVSIFECPSV